MAKKILRLGLSLISLACLQFGSAPITLAQAEGGTTSEIIEADARMVASCKFLGTVQGNSMWRYAWMGGLDVAKKGALKKATALGATHIIWEGLGSDGMGVPFANGKAYQCDAAALAAANQPVNPPAAVATPPAGPSRQDVYRIANQSTVLIEGQAPGSGVIISRVGSIYYVLTARHVVATRDEYMVVTANGKKFPVDYSRVRKIGNLDLALLQFTSSESFTIAQLGQSERIGQGDTIFVSGWPAVGQAITRPTHQVTDGRLTGFQRGDSEGYELTYNNATAPGMSGGPVFDATGRVVGIHGRAAGNQEIGKVGINLGIPIHLFLRQAPQAGLNLTQLGLRR